MSLTVSQIEDLLVTKIKLIAGFTTGLVDNLTDTDNRQLGTTTPGAHVALSSESVADVRSRLMVNETYSVLVIQKKGLGTIHTLCDSVRDAIHGKDWGETDISPFQYIGRELVEFDGAVVAYRLKFSTVHVLQIPTLT